MSALFPTQGHYVVYICPNIIFQILPSYSRPMTSHHVTCNVTAVSCASSSSKNKKEKEKKEKKKNPYKVRKENKNCLCPEHPITYACSYVYISLTC